MKLQHELSKILEDELGKHLQREIDNTEYLPQEAFASCRDRSKALLSQAFDRVTNTLTLAIIEHEEKKHEANYESERVITEPQMSTADIEVSTKSWWLN